MGVFGDDLDGDYVTMDGNVDAAINNDPLEFATEAIY